MSLCEHVYRRGGVYWWRRRFAGLAPTGARTVAVSLGVRDPAQARIIGARLDLQAYKLMARCSDGEMSLAAIKDELAAVTDVSWEMDDEVIERFVQTQAALPPQVPKAPYTADQERHMLHRIGEAQEKIFARQIDHARQDLCFDSVGRQSDRVSDVLLHIRVTGLVCDLLAQRGSSAHVGPSVRETLRIQGWSDDDIGVLEKEVLRHARVEPSRNWQIGPSFEVLVTTLEDAGASASNKNTLRLRRSALCFISSICADFVLQALDAPPHIAEIYEEFRRARQQRAGGLQQAHPSTFDSLERFQENFSRRSDPQSSHKTGYERPETALTPANELKAPDRADKPSAATVKAANSENASDLEKPEPPPSFRTLVDQLAIEKTRTRPAQWTEKTAHQHRAIAALFAKLAGTDDPRQMSQRDIGSYRTLLSQIPKNYGKSSQDQERTLDEILARAEDLEDEEVGLAAGTIERHLTQLNAILTHMAGHGFSIGTIPASAHVKDREASADKRNPFSNSDLVTLFKAPIWTGCLGPDDRLTAGSMIIHDCSYWAPLIGCYMLLRLSEICGMLVQDVDLERPALEVRDNTIRGIKTPQSKRRVPVPPELVRLGFIDYVKILNSTGQYLLFPELRLRGSKTPLQNFFYKDWKKLLKHALPKAGEEKKTFHSLRKTGNTAMVSDFVDSPIYLRIMGHKLPGVNGRHYVGQLDDKVLLQGLAAIPLVTADLQAVPIVLAPGVTSSA